MSVLGYLVSCVDNSSYMYRAADAFSKCGTCGFALDHEWISPDFQLSDRRFDISSTYDHYVIVSTKFADRFINRGARFVELPTEPGWFSMRADEVVVLDSIARKTRFEQWCGTCQRFTQVAGLTPVYLSGWETLPDRFLRSDLSFGSGNQLNYCILVGPSLGAEMKAANLSGLELEEIVRRDPLR
jgi:hypothetical protein